MEEKSVVCRLGSVVDAGDSRLLITGYDFIEKDGHMEIAYQVVPYLLGYTGKLRLISVSECSLVSEGFVSAHSDNVVKLMNQLYVLSKIVPADDMKQFIAKLFFGENKEEE